MQPSSISVRRCLLVLGLSLLLPSGQATAEGFAFSSVVGSYTLDVSSYRERQFNSVVRQKYDFSCGSAALATLLKYHYNRPNITEQDILKAMYAEGDQDKITREGFSLLDMKKYLTSIGLNTNGYRASLDRLIQVGIPAIVLINNNGYLHFVVVKGVRNELVLVGDPALGVKVVSRQAFEKMSNGILFVVLSEGTQGKQAFNRVDEWSPHQRRYTTALNLNELASFSLHSSPTPNYFF